MKKIKCLSALLFAIAMALNSVWACESIITVDDDSETYSTIQNEISNSEPITFKSYYINPTLQGMVDIDDLSCQDSDEIIQTSAVPTFDDAATAGAYLRSELKKYTTTVVLTVNQPYSEALRDSIMEATLEHTGEPDEGDYLKYGCYTCSSCDITAAIGTTTFAYTNEYMLTKDMASSVDSAVSTLVTSLNLKSSSLSDYQKLLAIHDYMCKNISYDYEAAALSTVTDYTPYTPYASLVSKKSVCQGYATAFYRLALEAGVDCRIITSNTLGHAWNIVKLGDKYYEIDVTWDSVLSKPDNISYEYFIKGSSDFDDHDVSDDQYHSVLGFSTSYPLATTAYSYDPTKDTPSTPSTKSDQTVTVSSTNITKTYGDSDFNLNAKTNGNGTIYYTSDNTSVATVSNTGVVTIKGAGTAHITAYASETSSYNKSNAVTVNLTVNNKIVSKLDQTVTVSSTNITKTYGDSNFNLNAKTNGNGTMYYTSDNTSVATVSSTGVVTIKGAGTAHITAYASETSSYNKSNVVTVNLAVNNQINATEDKNAQTVTVSSTNITKTYGDSDFNLNAKTSGNGTLHYVSKNTDIAAVSDSGVVTIKGVGTTYIYVYADANDDYNQSRSAVITLTVNSSTTSSDSHSTDTASQSNAGSGQSSSGTTSQNNAVSVQTTQSNNGSVQYFSGQQSISLSCSPSKKTFSYSKCKKSSKTFYVKTRGSYGIVRYRSSSSHIKVCQKGKITVKKKTPKGTYKVYVTAYDASQYRSTTKTVTIKVK